ncbi:MAG: hypothetical protein QNJ16_19125 [Rhodobacter sp.]|nr:hypothetical protein [Rhodobacter sp.]
MITFNLEVGGSFSIYSMQAEEAGVLKTQGVLRFLRERIANEPGVHGIGAIQELAGVGKVAIPNDLRFVLDGLGIGYNEVKTKGFIEVDPEPISSEEVR